MKNRISIIIIASLASLAACDKTQHDIRVAQELGVLQREYVIDAEGGSAVLDILSNNSGTVRCLERENEAWTSFDKTSFEGDSKLTVTLDANKGFQRRSDILLEQGSRRDTVSLFQKGAVDEKFYIAAGSMIVYNGTGKANVLDTEINVPFENISTEVRYPNQDGWIKDCKFEGQTFSFSTEDNKDAANTRTAYIFMTYTNGWKQKETINIKVIQARADNYIGTIFTYDQLRSLATVDGYTLPDDAMMEGYVVSTTEGGNAGDISVEDYTHGLGTIDYTPNDLTTYLETVDGKYGFRLIADKIEHNDFVRYSKICFGIGGAVITKTSEEPVRYTITGVSSENILTSMDGTHSIPAKEMYIEDLCDDDMYTLVQLKECEIPMRKGPFTPVNEGYTPSTNYNRLAKYPMLFRDKKGGSMYMFTNVTCTYRRNGKRMPYGSGTIKGVVVHETYKSFAQDGNFSRYQLRHMVREDIDLAMDFKDNFSALITEFRYAKLPGEFDQTTLSNAILATEGNGEMHHTYGAVGNFSPSYFYIGKCGSSYKSKYKEGAGIEFEDGTIYQPWVDNGTESAQNTDGKGWFKDNLKISWSNKYWWDGSKGYSWVAQFSTEGVSSDKVSLQFAMYNNSQSARSPRYWKAEYALCAEADATDSDWKKIGEFTVHDVAIWATQNDWQTLGTRVYDFPLPTEILGKKAVCIRLTPRNNKAAAKSVDSYDDSTIANNSGYNTMDYFAVRYNK